jgi:hypothetical protein
VGEAHAVDATASRVATPERLEVAVRAVAQIVEPAAADRAGHGRALSVADREWMFVLFRLVQHLGVLGIGAGRIRRLLRPGPGVSSVRVNERLWFGYDESAACASSNCQTATSRTGS